MHYFKQVKNSETVSVEAKSVDSLSPDFVEATKVEYDDYIASLPPPPSPEPTIDLVAEIRGIKERIEELEKQ